MTSKNFKVVSTIRTQLLDFSPKEIAKINYTTFVIYCLSGRGYYCCSGLIQTPPGYDNTLKVEKID